jgi:chaperonin GroES
MKFQPLYDRVVIKADEPTKTTRGGIILTDTTITPFQEGEVVAIGTGVYESGKLVTPTVKIGDRVMFTRNPSREITIEGDKYLLLQEKEVLGII